MGNRRHVYVTEQFMKSVNQINGTKLFGKAMNELQGMDDTGKEC